jgi:hypothetical protein
MTALTMHLFTDRRETDEAVKLLNDLVRMIPRPRNAAGQPTVVGLSTAFTPTSWSPGYPQIWEGRFLGVKPDLLLECIRDTDWRYPVLVVYRESGDNRWNYSLYGMQTPEWLRD